MKYEIESLIGKDYYNEGYSFLATWKGPNYKDSSPKIGVLMNSLYCLHDGKVHNNVKYERCRWHEECTSVKKGSEVRECPFGNNVEDLHNCPETISDVLSKYTMNLPYNMVKYIWYNRYGYANYTKGARAFCEQLGISEEEYYCRVVAKEYIDFFLPQRKTNPSYMSDRDFESFEKWALDEGIELLHCWGVDIRDHIVKHCRRKGYKIEDYNNDKSGYINLVWLNNKRIVLFCSWHPGYSGYYDNGKLKQYANTTLEIASNK